MIQLEKKALIDLVFWHIGIVRITPDLIRRRVVPIFLVAGSSLAFYLDCVSVAGSTSGLGVLLLTLTPTAAKIFSLGTRACGSKARIWVRVSAEGAADNGSR